jgi:hypothetical protein
MAALCDVARCADVALQPHCFEVMTRTRIVDNSERPARPEPNEDEAVEKPPSVRESAQQGEVTPRGERPSHDIETDRVRRDRAETEH